LKAAGVQWVFIDLPGRDGPAASAGLRYSDLAIVPCRPVEDDIEPSIATVGLLRRSGRKYAYLMNIVQPQIDKGRARKVAEALQAAGHVVCPVAIVLRISVSDASARGLGVNEYQPESSSARDYGELFAWIEGQLR
jgi:chromosome partitioning protein